MTINHHPRNPKSRMRETAVPLFEAGKSITFQTFLLPLQTLNSSKIPFGVNVQPIPMKRQGLGLHSVHLLWLNTSCAPYITVAASPAVIFCTDLQLKAKDKNRFFSVGSVSLERFVCSLHFPSFFMCCWKRHNLQIMLTIFPLTNVSTQPVRVTGVGLLANISCVSSFPHYCFSDQPSC